MAFGSLVAPILARSDPGAALGQVLSNSQSTAADVGSNGPLPQFSAALSSFIQGAPATEPVATDVQSKLRQLPITPDDVGTSPSDGDSGPELARLLQDMKQGTSITWTPRNLIPIDPKKSVALVGHYKVKNQLEIYAKTDLVATNGLNSGLTLAADAVDNAIFRFSGSRSLPAWGNQNNVIGGGYNILKEGGALVRKNKAFPRAYNSPGASVMTNWAVRDVTFAGPYGIILDDVYSQNARIVNLSCVGKVDQVLSVQGHYILIDGLDKTGFTGESAEPLIVLGDKDNVNPTTNITVRRMILDLNGDSKKDSVYIVNAKNTKIEDSHNELSQFKRMLHVKDSYGTVLERCNFVTKETVSVVHVDNSDVLTDYFEANTVSDRWWKFFTLVNKSWLRIGRLRQYFSAFIPMDERIVVREIQNVSAEEPMIQVPFCNGVGNFAHNPVFAAEATNWSIGAGLSATFLGGNKYYPGGKVLRIVTAEDYTGTLTIAQRVPGMGVEFNNRPTTTVVVGEISHNGVNVGANSFMCPAETDGGLNQGRIYTGHGYGWGAATSTNANGTCVVNIVNPRAGWFYDIHFVGFGPGYQVPLALPPFQAQPMIAAPSGGATVDTEARAAIAAMQQLLTNIGAMKVT